MGLRPTKCYEDAERFNSWQALSPGESACPTFSHKLWIRKVGQALRPANSDVFKEALPVSYC
jgi:hypothetical protein